MLEGKVHRTDSESKAGDDMEKTRTTECGTIEVLSENKQKKLVRKIDSQ